MRSRILIAQLHRHTDSSLLGNWTSVNRILLMLERLYNHLRSSNPRIRGIIVDVGVYIRLLIIVCEIWWRSKLIVGWIIDYSLLLRLLVYWKEGLLGLMDNLRLGVWLYLLVMEWIVRIRGWIILILFSGGLSMIALVFLPWISVKTSLNRGKYSFNYYKITLNIYLLPTPHEPISKLKLDRFITPLSFPSFDGFKMK
jgi:hypothetical protein